MGAYQEAENRLQAIQGWVDLIREYEGSEVGDYISSLEEAISSASSAAYYDHKLKMVECMEEIVENAKEESDEGGWLYEMIEDAQHSHDEWLDRFKPEHRPNAPMGPMDRLKLLKGNTD